MGFTLVSFHAHPDDEVLLTGGTLARASADGHRVVLVMATDGAAGLTNRSHSTALAWRRAAELAGSARELGCARVVRLDYPDSGSGTDPRPDGFARCDVEEAAARLAAVLAEERADVLTVYDAAGGYGHPDHAQVHRVGVRAAELAATPVVLEATVDRTWLRRGVRAVSWIPLAPRLDTSTAYTAPARITHRVDVGAWCDRKRAALRAHASQAGGGNRIRTVALLQRLPPPLFRRALGHEWFTERGRAPGPVCGDIFQTLRVRG